ncbi:hypothetical protein Q7P37_001007 [Cladosporium fusiforme]
MLLSLPPSLLSLLFCFLESRPVLADPAPVPAPQPHGNIAGYIASGLGANNGSSSHHHTPSLASTGTGSEYASKCADALQTWSSASLDYLYDAASLTTYTFQSAFTETLQKHGTTEVTSVITLCDGHPRVVGHTSTSQGAKYTTTAAWTNTITETQRNSAFPTPPPCSIQPSDCKTLSSSFEASVSSAIEKNGFATGGGPLCTVEPSVSYSYSTNDKGRACDQCMIHASTARVMFWPVTTASGGNLCNKTASTITASHTGPPNSFITDGITITSPTVAVSLGFVSRVDGCGPTVDHTIIPVRPEEVTSVRGFRALFSHHRFNFADLNYFCEDTGTTNSTLDEAHADSCYQQVPAAAYFGGLNNAVVLDQAPFRNLTKEQMTIYNDYQPQLLPPQTMSDAINSLWGDNCIIHPDGVWDPPIALTPEAQLKGPSFGPGTTTTKDSEPESTPASPINEYGPVPPERTGGLKPPSNGPGGSSSERQHFTALPQTTSGSSPDGEGREDYTMPAGDGSSSGKGAEGSSNGSGGDSSDVHDGDSTSGGSDAGQTDQGGSNKDNSEGHDNGSSSGSSGGDQENGGDSSSGSPNGADGPGSRQGHITGTKIHTTIITLGSKTMTCSEDANGAWVIPDAYTTHAVSMGGSMAHIDGATFTADSDGLTQVHNSGKGGGSSNGDDGEDDGGNGDSSDGESSDRDHNSSNGESSDGGHHSSDGGNGGSSDKDNNSSNENHSDGSPRKSSQADDSDTATSESSTQQSSQANREQSTDGASSTGSGSTPTSSSDSDSNSDADASGASSSRWSPATFALAMVAVYICAL